MAEKLTLVWNDSYRFGHEQIDTARRKVFDVTNQFVLTNDLTSARYALSALSDYGRGFFHIEEKLIFSCMGQVEFTHHARSHRVLLTHLNTMLLSGITQDKPHEREFIKKSATVLEMWILNHFIKDDPKVRGELTKAADKLYKKRTES